MFCLTTNILPNVDALFIVKNSFFVQLTSDLLPFALGFLGAKLELLRNA